MKREEKIINGAFELLLSRNWECKKKQVDDEKWNEEMVTKCFDLSKEFCKQVEVVMHMK